MFSPTSEADDRTSLYLAMRKTYLMYVAALIPLIEAGDVEAAETYEKVEEVYATVEEWWRKVCISHT